jgi:hypothetical protein
MAREPDTRYQKVRIRPQTLNRTSFGTLHVIRVNEDNQIIDTHRQNARRQKQYPYFFLY